MTYKRQPMSQQTVWQLPQPETYVEWDVIGQPIIDVLERIDEALNHLHRSMVLLFAWDGSSPRLDIDANWNMAVIQTGAAIEGWRALVQSETPRCNHHPMSDKCEHNPLTDSQESYWMLRNAYVHILRGTTATLAEDIENWPMGDIRGFYIHNRTRKGKDVDWQHPVDRRLQGFTPLTAGFDVHIKPLRDFLAQLLAEISRHPEYTIDRRDGDAGKLSRLRLSVEARLHDKDWLRKEYEEQNKREVTEDWMKRGIEHPYDVESPTSIGIGNLTPDPTHYKDEVDVINRAIETAMESTDPAHASYAAVAWTEGMAGRMYMKSAERWLSLAVWILTNPDNAFGTKQQVSKAVSLISEAVEAWRDAHSPLRYKYIKELDAVIPASVASGLKADAILERDYEPEDIARWMFGVKGEDAERFAKEWQPDGR